MFKLIPPAPGQTAWTESVLWSFGGVGDGANPNGGLVQVGGNLYGITELGGINGLGTVFEVSP
jgi:uncharacterized repeat protein (TIGR03803 family)